MIGSRGRSSAGPGLGCTSVKTQGRPTHRNKVLVQSGMPTGAPPPARRPRRQHPPCRSHAAPDRVGQAVPRDETARPLLRSDYARREREWTEGAVGETTLCAVRSFGAFISFDRKSRIPWAPSWNDVLRKPSVESEPAPWAIATSFQTRQRCGVPLVEVRAFALAPSTIARRHPGHCWLSPRGLSGGLLGSVRSADLGEAQQLRRRVRARGLREHLAHAVRPHTHEPSRHQCPSNCPVEVPTGHEPPVPRAVVSAARPLRVARPAPGRQSAVGEERCTPKGVNVVVEDSRRYPGKPGMSDGKTPSGGHCHDGAISDPCP